MAEARLGVEPIIHEGDHFGINTYSPFPQVSFEERGTVIFIPSFRDLARAALRTFRRGYGKMAVAFAPMPLPLVVAGVGGFVFAVLYSRRQHWWRSNRFVNLLWEVDARYLSRWTGSWPVDVKIANLALLTSVTSLYCIGAAQRFFLRRLLSYHGYLAERRNPSLTTKIWFFLLKYCFIHRIHETLYAYQPCLPHLPLPALKTTVDKYFRTVEPLLVNKPAELAEHKKEMEDFLANEGPYLQRLLWLKWLTSPNYVADIWLQAVYLRHRDSLLISSNWFGITLCDYHPTRDQATRAAVVCHLLAKIHRSIENETLEPQLVPILKTPLVPVDMSQYEMCFAMTRTPHETADVIMKYDFADARHAAVFHKGTFYRVPLYSVEYGTRRIYTPREMLEAFQQIMAQEADTTREMIDSDPARMLPALTTMKRDDWARVREEEFLQIRKNRAMLKVIESAAFVMILDDMPLEEGAAERGSWDREGTNYFVGDGCNRWVDKSCSWIISRDGSHGVNGEHSSFDAPVIAHLNEMVATAELRRENYNPDGTIKALPDDENCPLSADDACKPTALVFHMSERLSRTVFAARDAARAMIKDVVMTLRRFPHFGKQLISKQVGVSPDAFIQMALQLAYYRDQGHFDMTYESSGVRFFQLGRTETIRSLSHESCAFVRAFLGIDVDGAPLPEAQRKTKEEQYALLVAACDRHQHYSQECVTGEGCDRHLLALYAAARMRGMDSTFLYNALRAREWKLSTSQIPPQQLPDEAYEPLKGTPEETKAESPNGGFGPVADDGYGICYMVRNDNVYFSCSMRPSKLNTDAERMQGRVVEAMLELRDAFANPERANKGKK